MKIIKNVLALFISVVLLFTEVNSQDLRVPVSEKQMNNAESTFRFAIVSDRTGGMRGGIFEQAVAKLNILQPEFVVSIGDLIDGYTEDPEVWNAQWDEFDEIIERLDMPFYYIAGNHDTSNELLIEVWRERHGRDYYHFRYKNVLFLALNTDAIKNGGLGEDQIAYFEKVLKENEDVDWTLLFIHRPLWSYGERAGYEEIEKALGDRNYTLFSGHHHHYRYKLQNGMEHFTLATTGGGSWMRNKEVGEFDHITWVTMKEDGPVVAHIELSGILEKDIVPEEDYADIQVLRRGEWIKTHPVVHNEASFSEIKFPLTLENATERELAIRGELPPFNGIVFYPKMVEEILQPSEKRKLTISAKSEAEAVSIAELNNDPFSVELSAGFERPGRSDIKLSASKEVRVDWIHSLEQRSDKISIDGKLDDWDEERMLKVDQPQYFREGWDWKGKEDGRLAFSTFHDNSFLYIAVKFYDENIIAEPGVPQTRQDKFYIHIDPDPEKPVPEYYEILLGEEDKEPVIRAEGSRTKGVVAAVSKGESGQILEFAYPISQIIKTQGRDWKQVRINIGVMDHDRPENTKPSELWWRPVWSSEQNYERSGIFVRNSL